VDLVGELVVERCSRLEHEGILARRLCCGQTQLPEAPTITVYRQRDCYRHSLRDVLLLRAAPTA
jgi:hypothetical protein